MLLGRSKWGELVIATVNNFIYLWVVLRDGSKVKRVFLGAIPRPARDDIINTMSVVD